MKSLVTEKAWSQSRTATYQGVAIVSGGGKGKLCGRGVERGISRGSLPRVSERERLENSQQQEELYNKCYYNREYVD